MQKKMQRIKLTPLPTPKRPVAVRMSLTDEIKQVVREGNVDSFVFHEKDCGVKASYTVTYKKADANSEFTTFTTKLTNLCLVTSLFWKILFWISPVEDQIYSGGGITDLVFDDNNQERQSWRFCNSRLPRSEVLYFSQIFIILFVIAVSLIKLVFFNFDC